MKPGSDSKTELLGLDSTVTGGADVLASVAPEPPELEVPRGTEASAPLHVPSELHSPKTTPSSPKLRAHDRARSSPATATEPTEASIVGPIEGQVPLEAPFVAKGSTAPPPNSAVVGGRYKRMFTLGTGGLGEVEACEDLLLGRTVAVKAGHARGDVDAYSTKLILAREARIISVLEHPNIIPIYDAGTDPTRGPFYVMRQVTDTSLEMLLHQRKTKQGEPHEYTLHRLLRYFLQVCNAVEYAHARGVIHCDIKPANVLLGDYGEVLLVDWGLAQSRNHPLGVRGGTLGYMAPEQMDHKIERFDERTDVFALGALLYEILCGKAAFEDAKSTDVTTLGKDPFKIYRRPALPTAIDPTLSVPPEVEDICMRAIAVQRDERVKTVKELSTAIDEYIEGTKQKQRQLAEADKSADAGDDLAERYHEFVESRPEKLTVFRALRADVAPWAPIEDKADEWDAEDMIRVTDALQVRTFHSAVSAYERALDQVPNHERARRGLARLYFSRLQHARARGETLDQIAYEQLLREVDDGTYVRELQRDGELELAIDTTIGRLTLATLGEQQRRLVDTSIEVIAERPHARRSLAAGRYIVTATVPNAEAKPTSVSWPVRIEPGAKLALDIAVPKQPLSPDEVYVPGGAAWLGGDPLSAEAEEPGCVEVAPFIIQRFPVTFGHWFQFLDDVRDRDPALVWIHVPRTTLGLPTWNWEQGEWKAEAAVPTSGPPDPRRLPVFGISAESAEVYAKWLSARDSGLRGPGVDKITWRLPTELEWEKAGRGTDGRTYPWGEHFDATFCKMRDSRPGIPLAEAIGSFPLDSSPYGVRDLAGGVADWCIPDPRRTAPREPREVVSRGGAWCDWPIDCRLASRRRYLATEHSARVGVRLVRDL